MAQKGLLSVNLKNLDKVKNLLNIDMVQVQKEFIKELGIFIDRQVVDKIDRRIYAFPPSKSYKRTGAARKGRKFSKLAIGRGKFVMDSTVAGADKNYTPMLNKNKRIRRFNSYFWDDAVEATNNRARIAAKYLLRKQFKGYLK